MDKFKRLLIKKDKEEQEEHIPKEDAVRVRSALIATGTKTDEEVIEGMDRQFYTDGFDSVGWILHKLPDDIPPMFLENKLSELDTYKAIIEKKLSEQVIKNYSEFMRGMQHIHDVKMDLSKAEEQCNAGREGLKQANDQLVRAVLVTLARHRKRTRMNKVLRALQEVKSVRENEAVIDQLLEKGDFPGAVEAYGQCRRQLKELQQYQCLMETRERFARRHDIIKEKLHSFFASVCQKFSDNEFKTAVKAMLLLGEGRTFITDLRHFFSSAIDMVSKETVITLIPGDRAVLKKKPFKDLALQIPMSSFLSGYLQVCEKLCNVLFAAFRMPTAFASLATDKDMGLSKEDTGYVERAAEEVTTLKNDIWKRTQQQLSTLLSAPLTTTDILLDEFLHILNAGYKLIDIGEQFSGSESTGLRSSLLKKSKEYVKNFHQESFGDLKNQLEKETWKALSLDEDFSIRSIKELRLGEFKPEEDKEMVESASPSASPSSEQEKKEEEKKEESSESERAKLLFKQFTQGVNPFEAKRIEEDEVKKQEEAREKRWEEQKEDRRRALGVEDALRRTKAGRKPPPFITDSSIQIACYMGKNIAIMRDLSLLAIDAVNGLRDLVDFYLYSVFMAFGTSTTKFFNDGFTMYPRLKQAVRNVRRQLEQGDFGGGAFKEFIRAKAVEVPSPAKPAGPITQDKDKKNKFAFGNLPRAFGSFEGFPGLQSLASSGPASSGAPAPAASTPISASASTPSFAPPSGASSGGSSSSISSSSSIAASLSSASLSSLVDGKGRGFLQNLDSVSFLPTLDVGRKKEEEVPKPPILVRMKVNLNNKSTLHGLIERILAAESLCFIVDVIQQCKDVILGLVGKENHAIVKDLLSYCLDIKEEFRRYTYRNTAPLMIYFEPIATKLVECKWDAKQLQTRHNDYVDAIIAELKASEKVISANGGLPKHILKHLWANTTEYIAEKLVDGYSKVKKCTTEGRGQMSQDLNMLREELEALTGLAPLPNWDFVSSYVIAYYLPEQDFLLWMKEHPGYSLTQYESIANLGVGAGMTVAKKRRAFLDAVAEQYKKIEEQRNS